MHEGGIIKQLMETFGKMGIIITLIVVIVLWAYTYVKKTYYNQTNYFQVNIPERINSYYNRKSTKWKKTYTNSF